MKKTLVIGLAVVLGIGLIGYAVADPDHGRGRGMGSGPGWMHRGGGYGPGLMHRGSGYGPGWMHRGPGVGLGFNPCGQIPGKPAGETLTKEKAETLVKQQLARLGNPNLKLGSVKEERKQRTGQKFLTGRVSWCRRRDSNPHGRMSRGILSPLRLPFRHSGTLDFKRLTLTRFGPMGATVFLGVFCAVKKRHRLGLVSVRQMRIPHDHLHGLVTK